MIDTHCHLTYPGLIERLDVVLAGAAAAGITQMISVGTSPEDAQRAAELAAAHPAVFAAAGVHPHHAAENRDRARVHETLGLLAAQPRVVALGEMGLDRHYPEPPIDMQRNLLEWQLAVAAELPRSLPIIIHNREATDETLAVLRASGLAPERFVFHCFTGSDAELDAILAFGARVGFTGIITFKSARNLAQATARVPLDRLLTETDAPYLTPEPYRKIKTNEPRYIPEVVRVLARQRSMTEAQIIAVTEANARRFFGLPN